MADVAPAHSDDLRPIPDPSVLTTEALHREIAALRELLEKTINGMREVTTERFASIETQLDLIERQRVEQKKDTKDAVDAALAAAKEAVKEQTTASERAIAKSEAATTKSIDQLGEKFDTAVDGLRREAGDLKERVAGAESKEVGSKEAADNTNANLALAVSIVVVLLSIGGLIIALATK